MQSEPAFIQGVYPFTGAGLENPQPLSAEATTFVTPSDRFVQPTYVRAGNSSDAMVYLVLRRDEQPIRYFPIAAQGNAHVALAVVEELPPDTKLDVLIAAPEGVTGYVVVDVGLVLTNHEY